MHSTRVRPVRALILVAAVLGASIVMLAPSSGAAPSSWKLVDLHDSRCNHLGGGGSPGSYAVVLSGTWTKPLTIGMDTLPRGVTATPLQSPIAAGSSDGTHELAYVRVGVARRQATPGTYTMSLWVSDGTTRQQVPVTLILQTTRCTAY